MRKLTTYTFIVIATAITPLLENCNGNGPANPAKIYSDTTYKYGSNKSVARGQEIFNERCLDCHGQDGDKRKDNAANLKVSLIDSLSIVQRIVNGKAPMPAFGRLFPDSDMAQLVLYVKSLRQP